MLVRHAPKLTRTKTAIIASCIIAGLGAAGAAVSLIGGSTKTEPPMSHGSRETAPTTSRTPTTMPSPGTVAATSNPEAFAVSVAQTLFEWDTTDPTPLDDYTNRLLQVADPTGDETPGLVTDLSTYLPSPESWADLKTYRTRQWIDINSYEVPGDWKSAQVNGETTDLAAGTTAYTITGLRRRSGIWQGKLAQTVDQVSFTIFIVCQPTYDTCRLLRLSQLNNPLR